MVSISYKPSSVLIGRNQKLPWGSEYSSVSVEMVKDMTPIPCSSPSDDILAIKLV